MNKAKFLTQLTEVASLLGMQIEDPNYAYLALHLVGEGERGEKLFVRVNSFGFQPTDKISVSGVYPRFDGQSCSPKPEHPIGISLIKTSVQIAQDISRRVLPTYRENLVMAWERHDAWTASREQQEQMMAHIAREVQGVRSDMGMHHGAIYPSSPWSDFIYKIDLYSDNKVKMEITTSEDLAISILGVIKAHITGGQPPKEEGKDG